MYLYMLKTGNLLIDGVGNVKPDYTFIRVYMLKDTDGLIIEDGIREFDEGIRLKRLNPGSRLEGIFR
jgi:hypothetical protein